MTKLISAVSPSSVHRLTRSVDSIAETLTNFMSLIRYVQGETSLSALSKAATSDVEDVGQDPGKRPSDRIKGNVYKDRDEEGGRR